MIIDVCGILNEKNCLTCARQYLDFVVIFSAGLVQPRVLTHAVLPGAVEQLHWRYRLMASGSLLFLLPAVENIELLALSARTFMLGMTDEIESVRHFCKLALCFVVRNAARQRQGVSMTDSSVIIERLTDWTIDMYHDRPYEVSGGRPDADAGDRKAEGERLCGALTCILEGFGPEFIAKWLNYLVNDHVEVSSHVVTPTLPCVRET